MYESKKKIITFYSYKGGTGRTMALANTAYLLANNINKKTGNKFSKNKVLAIDWDLEAPGLHRYFYPYLTDDSINTFNKKPGCIDLFIELQKSRSKYKPNDFFGNRDRAFKELNNINFENYIISTKVEELYFMKAGIFDSNYSMKVSKFAWDDFYLSTYGFFLV